jgi:hypothetical protein
MIGSRSASLLKCLSVIVCATVALGPGLLDVGGRSTEFSLLTSGFLNAVFLAAVVTGGAGAAAFVVAARALVVLAGGGAAVGAAFVRDEARVGAVCLDAMVVWGQEMVRNESRIELTALKDKKHEVRSLANDANVNSHVTDALTRSRLTG